MTSLRAPVVVDDVGEDGVHLGDVRRGRGEHPPRGLGVGHDRRQRLIELVRERGRQLADGRHPADVRQLLPGALHVELGACADR